MVRPSRKSFIAICLIRGLTTVSFCCMLWWYLAISLAIVIELEENSWGADSSRWSSVMVSWFFFSFPLLHQYLLVDSPYRNQFAFIILCFFFSHRVWTESLGSLLRF